MQHVELINSFRAISQMLSYARFFKNWQGSSFILFTQFVTHTKTAFFSHRGNLMLNIFLLIQSRWALYIDNGYKRIPITLIDVGDYACIEPLQSHDKPISQEALLKTSEENIM